MCEACGRQEAWQGDIGTLRHARSLWQRALAAAEHLAVLGRTAMAEELAAEAESRGRQQFVIELACYRCSRPCMGVVPVGDPQGREPEAAVCGACAREPAGQAGQLAGAEATS